MPEPPNLPRPDDPLAALRRSVEAHQAATQASVEAGKQLQSPQQGTSSERDRA